MVVAADGDGNIYYWWQRDGSHIWNPKRYRPQILPGGTLPSGDPIAFIDATIAWTGNSVVIAAWGENDGNIYYWWQAADGGKWHGPQLLPGPFLGKRSSQPNFSPPSIAWTPSPGLVVISAVDAVTSEIYCWSQPANTDTRWRSPQLVGLGSGI